MRTVEQIHNDIDLREGGLGDFSLLKCCHYAGSDAGVIVRVFSIFDTNTRFGEILAGVAVYSRPTLNCRGRLTAADGYFAKITDTRRRIKAINRNILRLSRLIVLPRYRGLGLGRRLLVETLPLCGAAMVEAVAAMPHFGNIFEAAGFTRACLPPDTRRQNLIDALAEAGFGAEAFWDPSQLVNNLHALKPKTRERIINTSRRFLSRYRLKTHLCPNGTVAEAMTRLRTGGDYYWKTLKPLH